MVQQVVNLLAAIGNLVYRFFKLQFAFIILKQQKSYWIETKHTDSITKKQYTIKWISDRKENKNNRFCRGPTHAHSYQV